MTPDVVASFVSIVKKGNHVNNVMVVVLSVVVLYHVVLKTCILVGILMLLVNIIYRFLIMLEWVTFMPLNQNMIRLEVSLVVVLVISLVIPLVVVLVIPLLVVVVVVVVLLILI